MASSLEQTQERIDAAQKALEDSTKLYEDGKLQYEAAKALYNQSKAYYDQAKNFSNALNNPSFSPLQALAVASTYTDNTQAFENNIISNQNNAGELLRQQKIEGNKKLKVADRALKKAEKEVQKAEKFVKGTEKQISDINKQLNIVTEESLKEGAEVEQATSDAKVTRNKVKVTTNGVKAKVAQNKGFIKASAKALVLYAIGYLINNYLASLAVTVQNLTDLVNKTNDILASAQTKQDIAKSKVARDAAVAELSNAYSQIIFIKTALEVLQTVLTVFTLVLTLILLIPFPITAIVAERITKIVLTIDALLVMISVINSALSNLINEINALEARLLPLNELVDQAINNNLTPSEINELLNKKLGLLQGTIYRGFTFGILEENDPRFVVSGNKRRYAVAYDRSGFIVLQSKPSFTLDPYVLVEELKLIIDEQNLEP
jgi:hypothetical protein